MISRFPNGVKCHELTAVNVRVKMRGFVKGGKNFKHFALRRTVQEISAKKGNDRKKAMS